MTMQYRPLGNTPLRVSEIGVGGQTLGGGIYYRNDAEVRLMLEAAFAAGVNFYDTADHYNQGASETLIGKVLQGKRSQVILATKIGTRYSSAAQIALRLRPLLRPVSGLLRSSKNSLHQLRNTQKRGDFSPAYLRRALEGSLRRLRTDYVDLLQLHKPPADVLDSGAFCETLERFKSEGKIRFYGIACDHEETMVEDAIRCLKHPGIAAVQVTINLVQRQAIASWLPQARKLGLAVLVRNPRDQGYLTTDGSDIMAETYEKTQQQVRSRMERARRCQFLVRDNRTLAQAALLYLLQLPGVSSVLPRLYRREQLTEILASPQAPALTDDELRRIAALA